MSFYCCSFLEILGFLGLLLQLGDVLLILSHLLLVVGGCGNMSGRGIERKWIVLIVMTNKTICDKGKAAINHDYALNLHKIKCRLSYFESM